MALRVIILDGYVDEPAGLGVPPYIDVYPRYAAGAVFYHDRQALVKYYTIDQVRLDWKSFYEEASKSDLVIVIAGVVVPGKYLGGSPMTPREVVETGLALSATPATTILAGPAAVFGMGIKGGSLAYHPRDLGKHYDFIVRGDLEIFLHELLEYGEEKADPQKRRADYALTDAFAILGATIVKQHPNYGYNLMVEIETYRGCSRWVTGGCSFCVEPLYGKPISRRPESVLREVATLYSLGVRGIRFGRQSDFLVYGADLEGGEEFPKPNVRLMEGFLEEARRLAPDAVIHVDNVNPGTIARHPLESAKVLQLIAEYLSPGNVAALGLETADERVAAKNNLNATPEEAMTAIKVINEVGSERGDSGLPKLLPGINFVLGLPGETKETYEKNLEFLEELKRRNLLVRRINIRKVLVLPATRLYVAWKESLLAKHEEYANGFIWKVRHWYDPYFLSKVAPRGTVLKRVFVEKVERGITYARQMGSYPITVEIPGELQKPCVLDVEVIRHKGRSVIGRPLRASSPPLQS